jgi:hypothetical protein
MRIHRSIDTFYHSESINAKYSTGYPLYILSPRKQSRSDIMGAFQMKGQSLADKKETWGLAAAWSLPNPINPSTRTPNVHFAP